MEWIDVNTALPPNDLRQVVWTCQGEWQIATLYGKTWCFDKDEFNCEGVRVTHWLKIEAPYIKMFNTKPSFYKWVCQQCGKWQLKGTEMAMLKDCEQCGKKDVATFPLDYV